MDFDWIEPCDLDVPRVYEDALAVLERIGLKVANETARRKLAGKLPIDDGWARFPRDVVERYVEELRRRGGEHKPAGRAERVRPCASNLHFRYVDPVTGRDMPYDTPTLVRHTKLLSQLQMDGRVVGAVPGYPCDVPPAMQLLTNTYLGCVHNPQPHINYVLQDVRQVKYLLQICETFEKPLGVLTELISPMKFVGDSVDMAFDHIPDPEHTFIAIGPMPILGVTAPADWHLAYVQCVAENLGSYVILREAGFSNVTFPPMRLFVPNMRTGMLYFTSPKHLAVLLTRRKVLDFFGGGTDSHEMWLVTSKRPDAQAAAEKTLGALWGLLAGFPVLEGAGALWLDEMFSPAQLMIDLEIADYVNAVPGRPEPFEADPVETIRQGVEDGGFLNADRTLDRFLGFTWRPGLFDLQVRAGWDEPDICRRANAAAEAVIAMHSYERTDGKREQLERIMARARAEFS